MVAATQTTPTRDASREGKAGVLSFYYSFGKPGPLLRPRARRTNPLVCTGSSLRRNGKRVSRALLRRRLIYTRRLHTGFVCTYKNSRRAAARLKTHRSPRTSFSGERDTRARPRRRRARRKLARGNSGQARARGYFIPLRGRRPRPDPFLQCAASLSRFSLFQPPLLPLCLFGRSPDARCT